MSDKRPDGFCILPFLHMEIQIQGGVYTCCHTNSPKEVGNLHKQSLLEIWNSESLDEFKSKVLEGKTSDISHCQDCFYYEQLGAKSWREIENENWSLEIDQAIKNEITTPKSISIRFSNLCNFSCRTCRPSTSTGWFRDAKFLNPKGDYQKVKSTPESTTMLEQIKPFIGDLKQIHFVGGEPLMENEHYEILELLSKENSDVEITYDTNLSLLKLGEWDVIDLWNKFSKVNLSASIDGFGECGEFIRKGLDWNEYLSNWNRVKLEAPHVRLMMNFTLSMYNMFHILDFIDEMIRLGMYDGCDPRDFSITLVEEPHWQSLQCLPAEVKKVVEQRYLSYRHLHFGKVKDDLLNAIKYMKGSDDSQLLSTFRNFNTKLDLIRNESFRKLFSEEASLLGIK